MEKYPFHIPFIEKRYPIRNAASLFESIEIITPITRCEKYTKIKDEYKILVVKNNFSLREDSRLLSAPLPIVTLGPPLYIPVLSLNFYFITDVRCESPPG